MKLMTTVRQLLHVAAVVADGAQDLGRWEIRFRLQPGFGRMAPSAPLLAQGSKEQLAHGQSTKAIDGVDIHHAVLEEVIDSVPVD